MKKACVYGYSSYKYMIVKYSQAVYLKAEIASIYRNMIDC